jgi:thioredoxin 1
MKTFLLFIISVLVLSCNENNKVELQPKDFNQKVSNGNVQLLDVRTPEEFSQGHIANAVNIDIQSEHFDANARNLYSDLPVYVYCRSGSRSSDAAERLRKLGFKEVYELKGGILDWEKSGLPLVTSKPEVPKPDFKTAIQGEKLVLVDFNAVWCGPCRVIKPYVDRIDRERKDEVIVYSIDTDNEPDLAMEYGVTQLPTIMLFKKGAIVEKTIGSMDESKLNALVEKSSGEIPRGLVWQLQAVCAEIQETE